MPEMNALSAPRRAEPADYPAVLSLIRAEFAYMDGRIDPPSSQHRLTIDDIAQQARDGEIWVVGTEPLACVFLTPKPDVLYLGKLAVAGTARGRGLARALITTAAQRARALGRPALELQTRVELVENHATFAAMGFSETARTAHPGYARPTSLTMRKPV